MHLKSLLILIGCFFTLNSKGLAQTFTDADHRPFPPEISVEWKVETNFLDDGSRYRAQLRIENNSNIDLRDSGWALYFNYLGVIDPESVPSEIDITLINGNFYKLEPTKGFEGITAGEQFVIPFEAPGSKIKETDAPSGLYFVFGDGGKIQPVRDVKVAPFTKKQQTRRGPADNLPLPDAELRYNQNASLSHLPPGSVGKILPTPKSVEQRKGAFRLNGSVSIGYEEGLETEAAFLAEQLSRLLGKEIAATLGTVHKDILLTIAPDQGQSESYELTVAPDHIQITGADRAGVFYGIQSLRALLPPGAEQNRASSIEINARQIKDTPRFNYRGLHLDVARNFQSAATVKKLLDVMALYKLNKFHFHLTDDEGWRLPVGRLPELTQVGGRRGHTLDEKNHMIPSYGSGPDPDEGPGSGWYDRGTFIDLLQYATERHIEVIPEIDIPGHARAAIVAMKSRYEQYKSRGYFETANRFRLHEPADKSQYRSVQNWDDNVINVCQPSTYRFMETVVDEIVGMYEEAGAPLTTIHMGGDEVPHGAWEQSPACRDLINSTPDLKSVDDLSDYFFERIRKMLADRGLTMAGWAEIALDDTEEGAKPDPDFAGKVRPYVWANIWGSGLGDRAYKLANAGYEVVMSQASNFYFDLSYNNHPKEPGLYWAGFVGSRAPYEFIPFDLYKNAEMDVMGNPISSDAYNDAVALSKTGRDNILGLQGQLWGEKLISSERMEYMALPRLFGLAERAWAQQPDWAAIEDRDKRRKQIDEAWNEVANRLGQREMPRMDSLHGGMNYRLPPPGAIVESDTLKANTAYPGLTIRYTLDGSNPTPQSPEYTRPVSVPKDSVIKLRTFATDGRGSRTTRLRKDR